MPDYDYAEYLNRRLAERFPLWALGSGLWREYGNLNAESLHRLLDALVFARAEAVWGAPPLDCPRLFISHRRPDEVRAREVSALAKNAGFQVWLDVEDPALAILGASTLDDLTKSLLTATIIETALLNSTHVIALMTKNTPGSKWVPYEYGRAKDSSLNSLQAACWIENGVPRDDSAEYLLLGVTTRADAEISQWLHDEMTLWRTRVGTCTPPRDDPKPDPPPAQLTSDGDAIAAAIMAGTQRPIIVRRFKLKATKT